MTRKQVGEWWRETRLKRIEKEIREHRKRLKVLKCTQQLIRNQSEHDATSLISRDFMRLVKEKGLPERAA